MYRQMDRDVQTDRCTGSWTERCTDHQLNRKKYRIWTEYADGQKDIETEAGQTTKSNTKTRATDMNHTFTHQGSAQPFLGLSLCTASTLRYI